MSAQLPRSATDLRINLLGLLGMLAATGWAVSTRAAPAVAFPVLMVATALPILLLDVAILKVHRRPSTGLDFRESRPDPMRVATKLVGAAAMLGGVAAIYWLAPEYHGSFYVPFFSFLRWFGPAALALGALYFGFIDPYMVEPKDGYWHVGALFMGQRSEVDWDKVADLARSWVIKGFFVPLMFVYGYNNVVSVQKAVWNGPEGFSEWFDLAWHLGFLVDIVFTTMGYLATFRLFDTHVRSAEPTMRGWVVAIFCYQPFFSLVSAQYVMYEGGYQWGEWLADYPAIKALWGAVILLLLAMFSGSTVVFGCRFSNLTHRGILTNGFYRWTRHPAYVSKCSSFWLLYIPFIYHGSWYEVVRDCTWLSFLCLIYWLRARTEEQHLSKDPTYVAYATYMNDHSMFWWLGRLFPSLAYRPPTPSSQAASAYSREDPPRATAPLPAPRP